MSFFELQNPSFNYDALEPYMSKKTLELHHGKHHRTYVTNLNKLLENSNLKDLSLEEIIKRSYKAENTEGIFNNAAQHYNHIEFWNSMKAPKQKETVPELLITNINKNFGSFDNFKEEMITLGTSVFGAGWVWLAQDNDNNKLELMKCTNAVNPLVFNKKPILGCDVWEHSYYVDYENRRAEFLKNWFEHLVNWDYVASRLSK